MLSSVEEIFTLDIKKQKSWFQYWNSLNWPKKVKSLLPPPLKFQVLLFFYYFIFKLLYLLFFHFFFLHFLFFFPFILKKNLLKQFYFSEYHLYFSVELSGTFTSKSMVWCLHLCISLVYFFGSLNILAINVYHFEQIWCLYNYFNRMSCTTPIYTQIEIHLWFWTKCVYAAVNILYPNGHLPLVRGSFLHRFFSMRIILKKLYKCKKKKRFFSFIIF